MKENEEKWKKMKENERRWKKMIEDDSKWRKMKENEGKWKKIKENERKWKKMKNERKWKKISETLRKYEKFKNMSKILKNMKHDQKWWKKKEKWKKWIHTQNSWRFPGFAVVVVTFFVKILNDFYDFVFGMSFPQENQQPILGGHRFQMKSGSFHWTWNKTHTFYRRKSTKHIANVSPSNKSYFQIN